MNRSLPVCNKICPNSITEALAKNMEHAGWEGFYFYDLIFPLFLFLVGVLLPVVVRKSKEKGKTNKEIFFHISKRTIVLILLGLINYGLLRFDWPAMRWSSVLGRIGICYFFAGLLVLHTNWRVQLHCDTGNPCRLLGCRRIYTGSGLWAGCPYAGRLPYYMA